MAITTKQTLSDKKFRQDKLDELKLNGKITIGGELSLTDGNHGVGKIITSNANGKFVWTQTGIPNGVATLDSNGLVPSSQLPSYVDDVLEFNNLASFPSIGETGKIYVTRDTNSTYRWSGSQYIKVNDAVSTSESATKLATARNIQATGDATWQVSFDGSQNVTAALTLANTGVNANTYGNSITIPVLTIDSKGRITSATTNTVRSATQSQSGVMSSADKIKLDGIATNANNYSHPNHSGDVTSTGDGVTTISNDVVTNTKLANMGANLIKGRITTAGDPQDLTAAQVRTLLNVADGANNYTHPNHTGDVTSTGDGATVIATNAVTESKIINDAVTNTKLANMGANLIKGRITTSGDPQDLTATQVRTILNVADGANNYSHPNHTGDVTSSGDGSTTISNDAVTNSKLANMNANLIKGRITTNGDPQDLTATQVRTILNVANGANNYSHPNHTGDVTSSGDGATTISNNAVTNTKLADMAANVLKGRINTVGDPQDLTVAQVKTLLSLKSISEKDYWYGAQATYDAIPTKDANTIYFIPEP